MSLPHKKSRKSGFSLVEIIVSVTILVVFFVMAVSTATLMIHNMRVNEHRILATYYAEDLMNWLRAERERSWDNFVAVAPSGGQVLCANNATTRDQTVGTLLIAGSCDLNGINNPADTNPKIFRRTVFLRSQGPNNDQIQARVVVEWRDLDETYSVEINNTFYFLE